MLRIFLRVILTSALLGTGSNAAAEPPSGQHEKWVKGQILVQPRAGLSPGRFKKLLAPEGADSAGSVPGINVHIISVPPGAEDKVIKALSHNPNIEFAEKDLYLQPTDYTPNDPEFPNAWHLQTMNLPGAWDVSRGDGITVAVLDTGVNGAHEDLSGKMVAGRNVASNNADTSDIAGHGTQVAGVIGAVMDNGLGVASIAPNAWIMPIRATNDPNGWASTSTLAAGITWAADHGARVANVSYNASSSSVISTAAAYMRSRGGLVVVSAGNNGTNQTFADSESVISVSATTSNDIRASWSNYGNFIDVAAPGAGLWTTNNSGGYASVSGTSFAAPATAATIALIMATNPLLSPVEVEAVLESSAADLGDPGFDPVFGNGRVDALAAVLLAGGQTPIDNEPPTVVFANLQDGAGVSGFVAINAAASDNIGISKVELFDNQGLVGTDFSAPYNFSWDSARAAEGLDAVLSLVAHDSQGNFASQSITVHVNDTTAPVISVPGKRTVEATGPLTPVALGTATATDNVDGNVTVTPDNTGPFAVGAHVITWTASDSANNTATASQTITVRDSTPPTVTAPADISVIATGTLTGVTLGTATAIDLVDGSLTANSSPAGPYTVGVHVITWQAIDNAGNTGTVQQLVSITAPDTTPPQITPPPDKTVEATGPLTAVNPGSAVAVDNEDGSLTATPNTRGPFPPGTTLVTWSATDSEGNAAAAIQRITVTDTLPPTLNIPDDITVGASGFLSTVELGAATAFDLVSGDVSAVADNSGPFTSGRFSVIWSATDGAGNSTTAIQTITVLPQADFSLNQTVNEGSTVTVSVYLSGEAADYPVVVPYVVSGSANNPLDHDARDGEIVIAQGISGSMSFSVVDDGINGETANTVIFTMQPPVNAVSGTHVTHSVAITEENAAPLVDLLVTQQGIPVRTAYPFNGAVVVTADVSDPNPGDDHVFDWSLTDNSLVPVSGTGNREYVLDADYLVPGVYTVRLTVTDNGSPAEAVSVDVVLNVVGSIPNLSDSKDQDGDGVSDSQEGVADNDQDGISDYLDAISILSVLQGEDGISHHHLLVTEPGLRLSLGATAMAAGRHSASVTVNDIAGFGGINGLPGSNADDEYEYAGGLYDFVINGLTEAGQSVRIVLPQRARISKGDLYRKYSANYGWQGFIIDSKNNVASARGSNGVCPAPGDGAYRNGLHAGDYCIQLTLEDGGPNDQDGLRNGVIHDPSGVGTVPQPIVNDTASGSSDGGGGGGGGCAINSAAKMDPLWIVLLLIPTIGIQRRRLLKENRLSHMSIQKPESSL